MIYIRSPWTGLMLPITASSVELIMRGDQLGDDMLPHWKTVRDLLLAGF